MRKSVVLMAVLTLVVSTAFPKAKLKFDVKNVVKDTGSVKMEQISPEALIVDMRTGWNLGNTLDATGSKSLASETVWGQPKTTKAMIDGVKAAGFNTIRIPVSWAQHIVDDKYSIDPKWMARVKEIVDWAISDGMYVILNDHHDNFASPTGMSAGKGYYPDEKNYALSEEFFANVWSQIAIAFNNGYDQHLIFETMNEPRLRNDEVEWSFNPTVNKNVESQKAINKLNQVCVDAVRATKGNNATRYIMVPGYAATPAAVLSDVFQIPNDKSKNILISVHMYTPFIFAGQSPGAINFVPNKMQADYVTNFKKLNEKFIKNGYGVVIGEYGAVNKNNLDDRVAYFHSYIKYAKHWGLVACLWDNGNWQIKEGTNKFEEKFGYYNRKNQSWYFPEIIDAINEEMDQ